MPVDVLFPYYGDPALMKLAVRSVLDQHYRDFRLVVVDDGYPDESIPGWFASLDDPRVEYHRNESNLGANANYRKALRFVNADLVVVMGADDLMLPNYLEWLVDRAQRCPQAQIFQPGVFVIDEHGAPAHSPLDQVKAFYRPAGHGARLLGGQALAVSLLRGNWLYFPSVGWRAEAICATGFRPEYDVVQDLALALDLIMRQGDKAGALLLDDQAAFCYRRHSGSDSSVRAVTGTRFAEERRFFDTMASELDALGWHRAARTARLRASSRLHALSLLPRALAARNTDGLRNLAAHVVAR